MLFKSFGNYFDVLGYRNVKINWRKVSQLIRIDKNNK